MFEDNAKSKIARGLRNRFVLPNCSVSLCRRYRSHAIQSPIDLVSFSSLYDVRFPTFFYFFIFLFVILFSVYFLFPSSRRQLVYYLPTRIPRLNDSSLSFTRYVSRFSSTFYTLRKQFPYPVHAHTIIDYRNLADYIADHSTCSITRVTYYCPILYL